MVAKFIFFFILANIQIIRAADNQSSKTGNLETIIKNPKEFHDRLLLMKNRTNFCDAKIAIGNERIPVHKVILASSSEYFENVFTDNKSMAEIKLENMDVEIVKSLIEYCYTGIINVSVKNFHEIFSSANFLKISPIVEGCSKILEKKIDSSNCISMWKLGKSEHYENLRNEAFEYFKQNYEEISRSSEFLDLGFSEILEILDSDIAVTSEMIVVNSVKKWVNHDSASRKQYLDELSNFIKFENLPKNILLSEFHDLCSVDPSYKCLAKILNAVKHKEKNNNESADNSLRDSYGTLMAVGSYHENQTQTFEIFDLINEKWAKIENFNCNRTDYSSVLLGNKVMLIGGYNNLTTLNTVQTYDLSTGTMENLPPMKYARYWLTAIEFKGRVYAIGGWDEAFLPYVEMWDPILKIWKTLTSMSIARWGCQAAVLDEEILVVGGYNGEYLSDVESYNPVTDQWRKRTPMNEKRYYLGVAVVSGYLYVVGGHSGESALNTAEKYDPKTDKWKMIHSLNHTRYAMGSADLFGKLVIVGGAINGSETSTMEMYDDESDVWINMSSLNEPRWHFNVVKIPWKFAKTTLSREVPR